MKGARGLAIWCVGVVACAVALLVMRGGDKGLRSVGIALLATAVGVLVTRGLARRAVCAVVVLLAFVPALSGRAGVVVVGGVLAALGVLGVVLAGAWPETGRRYDSSEGGRRDEADLWTRIDRGEDPTA